MGSTLLGGSDFISLIKDKFLSGKKPDNNLPALKELVEKVSMQEISDQAESVFGKETALGKKVKMFLAQRYTGERLLGMQFGIGEPGVSQASRRVNERMKSDKKLNRKIRRIESVKNADLIII